MPGQLVLIRGISGSGKSTVAEMFVEFGFRHHEADQYFMQDGEYKFDPQKLSEAHKWCFDTTFQKLLDNENVVVSNTFTRGWELMDYIKEYKKLTGKFPMVLTSNGAFQNVHGLSSGMVKKQQDRFEHDISRLFS